MGGGTDVPVGVVLVPGVFRTFSRTLQVELRGEGANARDSEEIRHRLGQARIAPERVQSGIEMRDRFEQANLPGAVAPFPLDEALPRELKAVISREPELPAPLTCSRPFHNGCDHLFGRAPKPANLSGRDTPCRSRYPSRA